MFETIVNTKDNTFYHVDEQTLESVQKELGIFFPKELTAFYKQVGYGFIKSENDNFNRLMDPKSICDFRLRTGQFSYDSELSTYDAYERDKLVFFEICEGTYLLIGFSKNNSGSIYYGDKKIANSLTEFLTKYQNDENYFY